MQKPTDLIVWRCRLFTFIMLMRASTTKVKSRFFSNNKHCLQCDYHDFMTDDLYQQTTYEGSLYYVNKMIGILQLAEV